jgi:hypothetical protein
MNSKITVAACVTLFVTVIAAGNYYYRIYLKPDSPVYNSLCERQIAEVDAAVVSQYGKGALRVLDLRPDAKVTEKEINQVRSIRRLAVQLLHDKQENLCKEAISAARTIMKI